MYTGKLNHICYPIKKYLRFRPMAIQSAEIN
jgi:hypothetical protein